jgi:hypothetical protein
MKTQKSKSLQADQKEIVRYKKEDGEKQLEQPIIDEGIVRAKAIKKAVSIGWDKH